MRKTMVLMTMCCWIVAGAGAAVDGGEKAGAPVGTVKSRTFNVLNYGAVGDDKTDNTAAFSACLKAVIEAARELGCVEILSEDLSPEQNYRGIRVVNPFVT